MRDLEYKMYVIVAYNLSTIQKGVQASHALVRFGRKFGELNEYKQWADFDEKLILLDGGSSNKTLLPNNTYIGKLDNIYSDLCDRKINVAAFWEEDANDMLTAIAVLADERVWDHTKYPDYNGPYTLLGHHISEIDEEQYKEWVESIGGENNVFLRKTLRNLNLAR